MPLASPAKSAPFNTRRSVRLKYFFNNKAAAWIKHRHGTQVGPVRLQRRWIYILPSATGYAFLALLFIMLLWAINYSNSMGFALTFLAGGAALNAMWRCHYNLLGLRLSPGGAEAVFAGESARFRFGLDHESSLPRYGIGLNWAGQEALFSDVPSGASTQVEVAIPAQQRGLLHPGRLRITTRFPLGLFRAWSWIEFEQQCLVYPTPLGAQPLPVQSATPSTGNANVDVEHGNEDFAGLRAYVPGDSPRHIAWKASAHSTNGTFLVKRFSGQAQLELWLDWDSLGSLADEARLSQLCRWVLQAKTESLDYGLRLPSIEYPPSQGEVHQRRCLRALALYPDV